MFDWDVAGHREVYVRAIVAALGRERVVLAVPRRLADKLSDLDVAIHIMDSERPETGRHLGVGQRKVDLIERELFRQAIDAMRPDHAFHLFGDRALRWLVVGPPTRVPVTLLTYRTRMHYASQYGADLTSRERLVGNAEELLVTAWRRRGDAHAILTLDERQAEIWQRKRGAAAYWLPEPPVPPEILPPLKTGGRESGCVLFGALAERKGIESVARAAPLGLPGVRIVLAGSVDRSFEPRLRDHVESMRRSGVDVELRDHWHTETQKLHLLGDAECALIPYHRQFGMSRVLIEAAAVRTPVVGSSFGLIGSLIREHGLGLEVDCEDPSEIRAALLAMVDEGDSRRYEPALERFSARYSADAFRRVLTAAFGESS